MKPIKLSKSVCKAEEAVRAMFSEVFRQQFEIIEMDINDYPGVPFKKSNNFRWLTFNGMLQLDNGRTENFYAEIHLRKNEGTEECCPEYGVVCLSDIERYSTGQISTTSTTLEVGLIWFDRRGAAYPLHKPRINSRHDVFVRNESPYAKILSPEHCNYSD